VDLSLEAESFDVKCRRCGNVYPCDEVVTDDNGKLLCVHCNQPTEWAALLGIKKPKMQ
jgi:formylmethanofuran dehydrogenase subunit E